MVSFNDPRLDRYAAVAPAKVQQYCNRFHIPIEVGRDLVKLALFDIVLYIGEYVDNQTLVDFNNIR